MRQPAGGQHSASFGPFIELLHNPEAGTALAPKDIRTLRDALATYGVCKRLYCDNGPAFSEKSSRNLHQRGRAPADEGATGVIVQGVDLRR